MNAYFDAMRRYATFSGRSTRKQFWLFTLTAFLILVACAVIDTNVFGTDPESALVLTGIANLIHLLPSIAVTVRRLHDTDRSGWMLLLAFIPVIGQVALLVIACLPSTPGPNRFGAQPGMGPDATFGRNAHPRGSQGPLRASAGDHFMPDHDLPAPRPSSQPPLDQLQQLAALRAEGTIDETEFTRLKRNILQGSAS